MLGTETSIKSALANVHPRTEGVQVGAEVLVGTDSTNDEAVWVYVVVPDEQLEEFQGEWQTVRDRIREAVRIELGDPEIFVYVRMRLASEVEPAS